MTALARARHAYRSLSERGLMVWGLVALIAAETAATSEFFATERNLSNLLGQIVPLGLATLGQLSAILVGSIDLSVGATAKLTALLTPGLLADQPERVVPVILLVIAISAGIGAINGLLITRLRFEPLIATLITFSLLRGAALAYTRVPIGGIPSEISDVAYDRLAWVPYPALAMLLLAGALALVLGRTRWGRNVYATGGDPLVARRAGLRTDRIRFWMMVQSSLFAGLAGVVIALRLGVGEPRAGDGLELLSIAAAVIGGISIFGGRGTVLGALGGVAFISIVDNALNLQQVDALAEGAIKGLLIVLAVAIFTRGDR